MVALDLQTLSPGADLTGTGGLGLNSFYNRRVIAKIFKLATAAALLTTIVWLTREHLLPTPHVSHEPPPHYRSTPPLPETDPDDLTAIKGIGPVYADKLHHIGFTTFRALAEARPENVATELSLSSDMVSDWIAQARARTTE